jgi:hypothetical protein
MPRRHHLVLSMLLMLGLILPAANFPSPAVVRASAGSAEAPTGSSAMGGTYETDRKSSRPERERERKLADRGNAHEHVGKGPTTDREAAGPEHAEGTQNLCSNLRILDLPAGDVCTHGPDPAPPGLDIDEAVEPLSVQAASQEIAALPCDSDGQSGNRVQVLYVRGSDVASRYSQNLPTIRARASEANQIFQASAEETDGIRSLRFVHDATCAPVVPEVVLTSAGDGSFNATINELKAKGYNRTDRIYLAFVDTTSAGICGIGTLWSDDQPGSTNRNNNGPSYSRVDAGCWTGGLRRTN